MSSKIVTINGREIDIRQAQKRATSYYFRQAKRTAKLAEENLFLLAKLSAAGLLPEDFEPTGDQSSVYLSIDRKKAAAYRQALGVPLEVAHKNSTKVGNRYKIKVYLKPKGYDYFFLTFLEKPSPNLKCKLVKTRTTSVQLVCER